MADALSQSSGFCPSVGLGACLLQAVLPPAGHVEWLRFRIPESLNRNAVHLNPMNRLSHLVETVLRGQGLGCAG